MATSTATVRAKAPAELAGAQTLARPDEYEPGPSRLLHGATRWYATPWSRWALGWDRETTCLRCGQVRHERARLTADRGSDENN
jgi:hypothetical protein